MSATGDLAEARRRRRSRDDGICDCGNYRAVCSPMGRRCCYAVAVAPAGSGEQQ